MSFEGTVYEGLHQSGTKFYRIYSIKSGTRGLLVKNWGKAGASGRIKIEKHSITIEAAVSTALREREAKGYDMRRKPAPQSPYDTWEDAIQSVFMLEHRPQLRAEKAYMLGQTVSDDADARKIETEIEAEADTEASPKKDEPGMKMLRQNPMFGMFG